MAVDFNEIKKAVQRRNEFLNEHPELMPLQEEINMALRRAGSNKHARNVALQTLMLRTWMRILEVR